MSRFRSHHFVGDYHYLENKKVLSLTIKKIITSFLEFQRHFLKKPDHCVSVSEFVSKLWESTALVWSKLTGQKVAIVGSDPELGARENE